MSPQVAELTSKDGESLASPLRRSIIRARGGRDRCAREVPLFASLERAELERLAAQFKEYTFPQGAAVTREGERGARVLAFFVITEGRASVTVGGETKAVLGPGDHFGEIGLPYDQPRTATVIAEADLRCYALSAWNFRPFVEANPQIARPIMETMAERLADNAAP
ncbi:MAG: cyclic nucleotide-binding domain-containing protein [Gaiellaceae bacterium]